MLKKENALRLEKKRLLNGKYSYTYVFECLGCGGETKCQSGSFKVHSGKCSSCVQKGRPFQAAYRNMIRNPHTTGVKVVELTYDEFIEFTKENQCHYCNSEITWVPHCKDKGKEVSAGRKYQLDRKDNNGPYSKDNCVVCCSRCNFAKGNRYTYEQWYGMTAYFRNNS